MMLAESLNELENLPLFITCLFIFGLCIGSFLNVVIYRLPQYLKQEWETECRLYLTLPVVNTNPLPLHHHRSFCPTCFNRIALRHNIPLLSFLWLKGRCFNCAEPISWQYPVVELLGAGITLLFGITYGLSLTLAAALIFGYALLALSVIDFKHQLLPDCLTYSLLWSGLLVNRAGLFVPLENAVLGACLGYAGLWLFAKIFHLLTHKDGMAAGDMKLLAAIAAWQGTVSLLPVMLIASLTGSLFGAWWLRKHPSSSTAICFGPFLALAGIITLCFRSNMMAYIPMLNL